MRIDLSNTCPSEDGMMKLSEWIGKTETLHSFTIMNIKFTLSAVEMFSVALSENQSLDYLNLSKCSFVKFSLLLKSLQSLETLSCFIFDSVLSDGFDMNDLAQLLNSLNKVDFSQSVIRPLDFSALLEISCKSASLDSVFASGISLTVNGLVYLFIIHCANNL
jgi:hypothetical protein